MSGGNAGMADRTIAAFVAGSAYPVVFVPFTYLGVASLLRPESGFVYQAVVWFFPLSMGLWNVLFVANHERLAGLSLSSRYWLAGIVLGIIFPLVGNATGVPGKLFGLEWPRGLVMVPIAMLGYGLVWRFLTRWMNRLAGLTD